MQQVVHGSVNISRPAGKEVTGTRTKGVAWMSVRFPGQKCFLSPPRCMLVFYFEFSIVSRVVSCLFSITIDAYPFCFPLNCCI